MRNLTAWALPRKWVSCKLLAYKYDMDRRDWVEQIRA